MLFNSPLFLFLFLPATVAAYIVLRQIAGPRAVLGLLLLASLFFYGWWNPIYVPLLFGLAAFNFLVARRITAAREAGRSDWVSVLLTFGIVADIAVLGYFKYTDFFLDTANALFRTNFILQHILLPLGISFFIFQKIAYLVDTSRGDVKGHDFLEYCFFVMFFPQLLAGPITHHEVIFSQIKGPWAFALKPSNFMLGLTIFVIGLFKKVVLADNFAPIANNMFSAAAAGEPLDFFTAWQGLIAFKFQLYFDFSGYSEMALGAARLFGIQLPLNFNSPYRALNVADYWRRWHMTLSRFLRDYVYIPLGGSRRGTPRLYFNLLATLALSGLWHGAAWHFVLWGSLQGASMVVNHAWRQSMAADQRLVVAHRGAARHVFHPRPDPGHLPFAISRCRAAGLSRHVQSADFVAGCLWSARLAGRPLRRPAGGARPADPRDVARGLARRRMVLPEHAAALGPLASGLQLRRGRAGPRPAPAGAGPVQPRRYCRGGWNGVRPRRARCLSACSRRWPASTLATSASFSISGSEQ